MLGRLAAWSLRVPVVVHTVHGAPFHPYQNAAARGFFRWCERFAAKRCHHIVSVADAMTEQLVAARVAPREQFSTIYSGMEVEPFLHADEPRRATRAALGFDDDQIVVGKIARLFHLKGHTYVIEAAQRVLRRCPQVRFLFVGDGILRKSLESQLARAGLSHYVPFHRAGSPGVVFPALIGAMDVLVHASLREGLARALPQALIAGKPVVSYDVDGAREVVVSGETGLLAGAAQCGTAGRRADQAGGQRRPAATSGSHGPGPIHGPVSTRDHDQSTAPSLPAARGLAPSRNRRGLNVEPGPIFRLPRACGRLEATQIDP